MTKHFVVKTILAMTVGGLANLVSTALLRLNTSDALAAGMTIGGVMYLGYKIEQLEDRADLFQHRD